MRATTAFRLLASPILAIAANLSAQAALPIGTHRLVLDCPGGELPFYVQLASDGHGGLTAHVLNGRERIEVPEVATQDELVLRFPHYDSELRLGPGDRLAGHWIKRRGKGTTTRMRVRHAPHTRRFPPQPDGERADASTGDEPAPTPRVDGRYRVEFEHGKDHAVGIFASVDGGRHDLEGTFLTTLGDYRFLAGNAHADGFRLSCFDGAHAFLFHARHVDGNPEQIRGDFWSSDSWHETWTGQRDDEARLANGWQLTKWLPGRKIGDSRLRDLDGSPRTLDDEGLRGTVRVIEVFGSWCPNCHDHGHYLAELHRSYAARGLRIVGVAFEHDDDLARSVRQVRAFRKRHGITYPTLLGGLSDKKQATATLGLLDRIRSFPTTIFVDHTGKVRGIYQGWSGPATGKANARLRRRFVELIEQLLREQETR